MADASGPAGALGEAVAALLDPASGVLPFGVPEGVPVGALGPIDGVVVGWAVAEGGVVPAAGVDGRPTDMYASTPIATNTTDTTAAAP
ncbi:hypothetical protein [Nonomuraea candida]|uniref:hypothetical protein n=1 Tax=Nonomuraea candida TaxID=359159 RepID=UPI0005B87685|nr:hypothetical protein [Nonomuraea candida]